MNSDMSEMLKNFSNMMNNNQIPDNMKSILNSMNSNMNTNTNNPSNDNIQPNNSTENSESSERHSNSSSADNSSNSNNSNTNNMFNNIDMNTILKLQQIMSSMNDKKNDSRTNLLISLKPYLKESRQNKVDQYIQLMKMEKIMEIMNPLGGDSKHV